MSMKRTAKLNDRTMEYYEKYDKLIKKLDNNFTKENVKNMRDELQILQENTEDELKKWQGSMLDYLDNYTVDHNQGSPMNRPLGGGIGRGVSREGGIGGGKTSKKNRKNSI